MLASVKYVLFLACLFIQALASDSLLKMKSIKFSEPTYELEFLDLDTIISGGTDPQLSTDGGYSWASIDALKGLSINQMNVNPHFPGVAVAIMNGNKHFLTPDSGKTWRSFELFFFDEKPLLEFSFVEVTFSSASADIVEIEMGICGQKSCLTVTFISLDGLKTIKRMPEYFKQCILPRNNKDFNKSVKPETLYCVKEERNSKGDVLKSSLHKSDDLFTKSDEVVELPGLKDLVIDSIALESAFFLVYLRGDKFGKAKNKLVVSKDLKSFGLANMEFSSGGLWVSSASPVRLVFAMPSTGNEIFGMELYMSDSTGLKVSRMPSTSAGSYYVSPVSDSVIYALEQTSKSMVEQPKFRSKMTYDNGATWQKLEVLDDPECELKSGCSFHFLHLFVEETPNLLACNGFKGQEGDFLDKSYSDLYVSRDGGASWKFALEGYHDVAYLDQGNIIVAIKARTSFPISNFQYSLDQGKTWITGNLEHSIVGPWVFTKKDYSGTKAYIAGMYEEEKYELIVLDFSDIYEGKVCSAADLETVSATSPEDYCYNGHRDIITRRKQDAFCLYNHPSEAFTMEEVPCECTAADYECSVNFELSAKQVCVPVLAKIAEVCKDSNKKIKLPAQQKIAGNQCQMKKKESDFVQQHEFNCKDIKKDHKNDEDKPKIAVDVSKLEGQMEQYSYVKSTNFSDNILLLTSDRSIYASNNGGQSFVSVPLPEDVLFFLVGAVDSTAMIVTEKHLYYSQNGGNTFQPLDIPGRPNARGLPIVFDPTDANKFVYITHDETTGGLSGSQAYYTEDAGLTFNKLLNNVHTCGYVDESLGLKENLLYCTVAEGNKRKLVSSKNYFKEKIELFDNVLAFALKPGFVFVALVEGTQSLKAKVTVDGVLFADADFPSNFQIDQQTAYTILDSASHSILMHVTTDRRRGLEKGALLKSNSNGTSYVLALEDVNRNGFGFVDFDRLDILEGTYIANTVSEAKTPGAKKLRTRISHNDGGLWEFLVPPSKDSTGKEYECVKRTKGQKNALNKCSLNLRSFTERSDYKDTFSSASAVGYFFGVGNVGEILDDKEPATFMSSDGGVTWKEVAKGAYMWEFGDRGTILVMVKEKELTNEMLYSTDNGNSWKTFQFSEVPMRVLDLATVPSDTSRKFMILGNTKESPNTVVVSIDFANYFPRQCQLDLDHPNDDDYEYWTPKLPGSSDNCIFGHVSQYLRRAEGHYDCFIGAAPLKNGISRTQNCACTVKDYECDYNFYRDTDGTCKLVTGLSPQDHKKQMCSKPDTFEYFEPTGYRKLPSSTCVGGKELDSFDPKACPGHEKEFNEKHGRNISFSKFLVLLFVPLAAFFGATWFVYERGVKRNGGLQRLGQIRLEDASDFDPIEENSVDKVVNGIVKGGIFVMAGTIASVKMIRKLDRKLFENVTGLLFGRRPGRRNYVRVPDDEDELFGDYDENYNDEDLGDVDFSVDEDPTDLNEFSAPADDNLFDIDDETAAESGTSDSERV